MEDIINVKSIGVDVRFNNKLQTLVQDPLDERLNAILQFGEMALQMKVVKESATNSLPEILLRQYITYAVLSVCADLCSEPCIIMFYWETFQQIP